jgi:hypothetical protein
MIFLVDVMIPNGHDRDQKVATTHQAVENKQ